MLHGHKRVVDDLVTDGEFLYSASSDGSIKKWSLQTDELVMTFSGHTTCVLGLCLTESALYSSSADKSVRQWDYEVFRMIFCSWGLLMSGTVLDWKVRVTIRMRRVVQVCCINRQVRACWVQ